MLAENGYRRHSAQRAKQHAGFRISFGFPGLIAFTLTFSAAVFSLPGFTAAKTPEINFRALYGYAQLANDAYASPAAIKKRHPNVSRVATPGNTDVLYFLEDDHAHKTHLISVRGTVDKKNWALDEDTRGVNDKKIKILVQEGFEEAANAIYADVKQHLKPGYKISLTGHSLGGAVAALLMIYFHEDGEKISQVVTFGQPKFTDEAGVRKFANLPLTRIVYQNDVVPMVPNTTENGRKKYAHIGAEVNILSGPYYSYLDAREANRKSIDQLDHDLFLISVPDHAIKWYLKGLRDKLKKAERVKYADREKYVVRHKRGQPVEPAKTKMNFNN
jgi:triacylglycerol lipase